MLAQTFRSRECEEDWPSEILQIRPRDNVRTGPWRTVLRCRCGVLARRRLSALTQRVLIIADLSVSILKSSFMIEVKGRISLADFELAAVDTMFTPQELGIDLPA